MTQQYDTLYGWYSHYVFDIGEWYNHRCQMWYYALFSSYLTIGRDLGLPSVDKLELNQNCPLLQAFKLIFEYADDLWLLSAFPKPWEYNDDYLARRYYCWSILNMLTIGFVWVEAMDNLQHPLSLVEKHNLEFCKDLFNFVDDARMAELHHVCKSWEIDNCNE